MRRLSLNARRAQDQAGSAEIHVALIEITHPELLDGPIRLSTDNAELVSEDPDVYGTRSAWRGADPATQPWLWIVASALLPSDQEESPATAQVVLENLDGALIRLLRSFRGPATAHMAVVMAATPDLIEAEWLNLELQTSDITDAEITLSLSRDEIELEPMPSGRMTRDRFPGLHL